MPDFAGSSKKPSDMTPHGVVDDIAATDDLAGDDLAAELQRVLDQARSDLNLDDRDDSAASAELPLSESSVQPSAEFAADQYEAPEQIISQSPPAQAKASEVEEDPEAFEKQLAALLNSAELEASQQDIAQSASTQPAASATIAQIDDALAEADAVADQIKEMNELIERAAAQPVIVDSNDDDMVTVEQIARLMEQANSEATTEASTPAPASQAAAAAITTAAPAPAPESLNQLDEFLAGHADHAVADAFETVEDVVSQVPTTPVAASGLEKMTASTDSDAEEANSFATPDELAADDLAQNTGAGTNASVSATGKTAKPNQSKANASTHATVAQPANALDAKTSGSAIPKRGANLFAKVGRIVIVCKSAAYRTCTIINRPLMKASQSTRKTIGIIGLLTMGNASLLILGKLLASLMG